MRDFFCCWQRKLGVVTLVLALIFAAGWVRSLSVVDELNLIFVRLQSSKGYIREVVYYESTATILVLKQAMPATGTSVVGNNGAQSDLDDQIRLGSRIGLITHEDSQTGVPYWSIVVPLTLLSAYLLLGKRRPPKSVPTKVE